MHRIYKGGSSLLLCGLPLLDGMHSTSITEAEVGSIQLQQQVQVHLLLGQLQHQRRVDEEHAIRSKRQPHSQAKGVHLVCQGICVQFEVLGPSKGSQIEPLHFAQALVACKGHATHEAGRVTHCGVVERNVYIHANV